MKNIFYPLILFLSLHWFSQACAQEYSLEQCMSLAKKNNAIIRIAQQSLDTRQSARDASRVNSLPKVDLLAGYNYIGEPIRVNLQQLKTGVIEGTASQNVSAANTIYQEITGNKLPAQIQDIIYQTSKDIMGAVYPNYNPEINKQSYFLGGIAIRQPIYLGGKLKAARDLSEQQLRSGQANLQSAEELTFYNIALQYIQITYLNSMMASQTKLNESLSINEASAASLLKAELLVPYQKNWATIAKMQGEANLDNLKLERTNALLTLKDLMGFSMDESLQIERTLKDSILIPIFLTAKTNADLQFLQSKKREAETGLNISKSMSRPNIYAIGNVQFFRKDLPLITPPWLVGIEMQWTLFDPERRSRNLASQSLVREAELLIDQKQRAVDLASKVAENKIVGLKKQLEIFAQTKQQANLTYQMVKKRMDNSLSSIKDVNDALQFQYEVEKLYYTAIVTYQTALATYFYIIGSPQNVTNYLH